MRLVKIKICKILMVVAVLSSSAGHADCSNSRSSNYGSLTSLMAAAQGKSALTSVDEARSSGRFPIGDFARPEASPNGVNRELAIASANILFQIQGSFRLDERGKAIEVSGFGGSAFLFGSQCHIVTSRHTLLYNPRNDERDAEVPLAGKTFLVIHPVTKEVLEAKVVGEGVSQDMPSEDFAVLKLSKTVSEKFPHAVPPRQDVRRIATGGRDLIVAGIPLDLQVALDVKANIALNPVVSGKCGFVDITDDIADGRATSCSIAPGNSGGFVGSEMVSGHPVALGILRSAHTPGLRSASLSSASEMPVGQKVRVNVNEQGVVSVMDAEMKSRLNEAIQNSLGCP